MAHPLTVLHGESGVGKSSLLRAGVAHRLRQSAGAVAVVVVDDWHDDPIARLGDAVDAEVAATLGRAGDARSGGEPLADRIATAAIQLDGELYVLLDQVEELLLYHGADAALLSELGRALSARVSGVSFLVAIRDDALAQLDALRSTVPLILGNTLRLARLTRAEARDAITRPLDVFNAARPDVERVSIEAELVEAVLDEVAAGHVEVGPARGGPEQDAPDGVEAPYLQLVLARVWEEEQGLDSRVLRRATLERLGGAQAIVDGHLRAALDNLSGAQRDSVASVFDHLVTPSGGKVAHSAQDLARYATVAPAELEPTLELLARARVLRAVATRDGRRYEIYHDILAGGVLSWTAEHQQQRALRRERERHRRLVAAVVVLAALCSFAGFEWYRAAQANTRSRARALAAAARANMPADPQQSLASAVHAVSLHADSSTIPVLRDALVASHERVVFRLARPITRASLSPDGRRVLLVSPPLAARVADARNGTVLVVLRDAGPARAAAWSPDGRHIVTAGVDGHARISDARTGRVVRTLPTTPKLRTAAFST